MATIYVQPDYLAASLNLGRQIAERHGPGASIDDFDLKVFDVPHEGSDRKGKALVACPKGILPNPHNILVAYWGDTPPGGADASSAS
jgi:hypothetical protein